MEVEQVISSKEIDERVVVALIKKVVQHPGADRLRLAEVETGEGVFRVVCGADNVREGLKVAFAQIGTTLPGGDRIAKVKLRGEVSEGMICSERELGLGNDHNGIIELSSDLAVGTRLCDLYPADTVIDLKTPANRFDVLSVVGLAREVAAMTGAELSPLPPALDFKDGDKRLALGKDLSARRYTLTRIKLGQTPPSPRWMTARLQAAGMRPVSLVVDVTNYVMLELGQPLHAFDAQKVRLPITVREARTDERLVTLDGVSRLLTPLDLVIADESGPIGLAGVMGGASTEIGPETTEILLEAAVFDGAVVRKMAKRHGLRTETSARFERGLPAELPALAVARAVELLRELAGAEVVGAASHGEASPAPGITLSLERLRSLLGFVISDKEALGALHKLQIPGELHKGTLKVPQVPWWRPDLRLAEDLVEEIVRVVGYDRVPSAIPLWKPERLQFDRARSKKRQIRDLMYAAGLFEVMTYSFVSQQQLEDLGMEPERHLKLKNPLSTEQAYLRSSLLLSHLAVLARNRMYAKEMGFYEAAKVFVKQGKGELPDEPLLLGVTLNRAEGALAHAKGVLEAVGAELNVAVAVEPKDDAVFAPGRAAVVMLHNKRIGRIGQLHPARVRELKLEGEVAFLEVNLTPLVAASVPKKFRGVERFPTIQRDLTVLLPVDVTWQAVAKALAPQEVEFVGDYYGKGLPEGKKSLTLRLTVAHPERTPTEAEANELEASMLARLERKLGALRRA